MPHQKLNYTIINHKEKAPGHATTTNQGTFPTIYFFVALAFFGKRRFKHVKTQYRPKTFRMTGEVVVGSG